MNREEEEAAQREWMIGNGGLCAGCGRPELHKWCPAYGTEYYMSGIPLPEGMETKASDFEFPSDGDRMGLN